jgi:amino acid transporter
MSPAGFCGRESAATAATVSLAFAGYLQVFAEAPRLPDAFALLALCTAVNIAGIRQSTWMTVTLTAIEAGGLLLVIALGFGQGEFALHASLPRWGDLAGVFTATAVVFFMYVGFEDVQVALVVLRLREPERERPFRVPLAVGRVPLLPLLGVLACSALLTRFEAKVYLVVAVALAAGLALHLFLRRRGAKAA